MNQYIYEFNKNKCWYKNVCSMYETGVCDGSCIRYMKMHYLVTNSFLPERQQVSMSLIPGKEDYAAFQKLDAIRKDILSFVSSGKNLFICSKNNGNGKTQWASKMMMRYFSGIWHTDSFCVRGLFINVTQFVTALKENIRETNLYVKHIQKYVYDADIVIWDDVGLKGITEHDYLYSYINGRINSGKSNIFTANYVGEDFKSVVGDRLYSRIIGESEIIELVGTDKRGYNK